MHPTRVSMSLLLNIKPYLKLKIKRHKIRGSIKVSNRKKTKKKLPDGFVK